MLEETYEIKAFGKHAALLSRFSQWISLYSAMQISCFVQNKKNKHF